MCNKKCIYGIIIIAVVGIIIYYVYTKYFNNSASTTSTTSTTGSNVKNIWTGTDKAITGFRLPSNTGGYKTPSGVTSIPINHVIHPYILPTLYNKNGTKSLIQFG